MKINRTINNYNDLVSAFKEFNALGFDDVSTLSRSEGKETRSSAQNRLWGHWQGQLAEQSGNGRTYERGYYKWHIGIPILARDDEWFNENIYNKFMETYTYEEILDIMGTDYVRVTSEMSVNQKSEFLENVKQDAVRRGYILTDLDDLYFRTVLGEKE